MQIKRKAKSPPLRESGGHIVFSLGHLSVCPYVRLSQSRFRSITLKPFVIFSFETWNKYKALSDNVQGTRTVTPPTVLTELFPFENLRREIVSAQ